MCTTRFHIDNRGKTDTKNVLLQVNHAGSQFKRSTGVKITLEEWDKDKGCPKNVYSEAYLRLSELSSLIRDGIYPELKKELGYKPSCSELAEAYDSHLLNRVAKPKDTTITTLIDKTINAKKSIYSESRIYQLNRLKDLVSEVHLEDNYEVLNKQWSIGFVDFLCYTKQFQNSSVMQHVKALKSVLEYNEVGVNVNLAHAVKSLRGDHIKNPKPFLTFKQLNSVTEHLNTEGIEDEQTWEVWSMFLFSSLTGCRHNELLRLTPENVINTKDMTLLRYTTSKTGKTIEVPLNDTCINIINHYKTVNRLLPNASNETCNRVLKVILEGFGLTDTVRFVSYSGKNRIERDIPLHDKITFHSSRRGFCSNLMNLGMSPQDISDLAGISVNTLLGWYSESDNETRNKKVFNILNSI